MNMFDVIVIGGGHAGCEAAHASARLKSKVALITLKKDGIGQMSCNPAIGGIGKSHLAREIDALDGLMSKIADHSALQRRKLNARKGPAVQATRIQTCRDTYKKKMQEAIFSHQNITVIEAMVSSLIVKDNVVQGVKIDSDNKEVFAKSVVLTTGTFLGGKIHIGQKSFSSGRVGDRASTQLEKFFKTNGFKIGRLKTGTPPRLLKSSIDFSKLQEQPSDSDKPNLSYLHDQYGMQADIINEIPCHITYTNTETHKIIKETQSLSPLFNGSIKSAGPRYCPSIEDKVHRFYDKESHQIFLEPETLSDEEIYPNGLSTCLPEHTQLKFLRTIQGLENCKITQPGYAIEYSYFDPRGLTKNLETKKIARLFFAGQINGTTGYEEAAAQGIIAGINAARLSIDEDMWCPERDKAYIGVMIDDLITLGVNEPYRMFTSRAEHRLRLREDNADQRLTEVGHSIGVVSTTRLEMLTFKNDKIKSESNRLENIKIYPSTSDSKIIEKKFNLCIKNPRSLKELLKMSDITYSDIQSLNVFGKTMNSDIGHLVAIQERYSGYLKRQDAEISNIRKTHNVKIPKSLVFADIKGLSNEAKEKLLEVMPTTLGQAARISGITPAIISLLRIYIKKTAQHAQ